MKVCSKCGLENIDEAQFCRNCGEKLNLTSQVSQKTDVVKVTSNRNSITTKVFYKTDKYDGSLRMAKTKTVSIIVFVSMFLFGVFSGSANFSFGIVFFSAIIFALIFAVPTFIIGTIAGFIIGRISH